MIFLRRGNNLVFISTAQISTTRAQTNDIVLVIICFLWGVDFMEVLGTDVTVRGGLLNRPTLTIHTRHLLKNKDNQFLYRVNY